jgi:hypothetical protein
MTLPEGGCIDLRLRLDVPRVPRRDVLRPEVALINPDQAALGKFRDVRLDDRDHPDVARFG